MKLSPLRLSFLAAVAICAVPIQDSQAALLAYEPFDYASDPGSDRNGDGKKDLMGLGGGLGFSGVWNESFGTRTDLTNYPLDSINSFNLAHPSGDPRFPKEGSGSLNSLTFAAGTPNIVQNFANGTLIRDLAEPILLTEGRSIWLSVLVRKDFEVPDSSGNTRPADALEIGLAKQFDTEFPGVFMGDFRNYASEGSYTDFGIGSAYSASNFNAFLTGSGPEIGVSNFLVMKLSIEPGNNRLEFFLNPSLDELSPVADVSLPLGGSLLGDTLDKLIINVTASQATWTVDEVRVGETYADVVPEPSSLLLTGLGVAMLGGSRLRRSRVSRN